MWRFRVQTSGRKIGFKAKDLNIQLRVTKDTVFETTMCSLFESSLYWDETR